MVTVIYSHNCCACHALMDWLQLEGIKYESVYYKDPRAKELGFTCLPTSYVDGVKVEGFARKKILDILGKS